MDVNKNRADYSAEYRKMPLKILGKIAIIFFLGIMVWAISFAMLQLSSGDASDDGNMAEHIRYCDRSYYDRDFADLKETLTLFELNDDEFDVYWEAVNGYETYIDYIQWTAAAAAGMQGAEEHAQQSYAAVRENAENCQFSQNETILQKFWTDIAN